MMSLVVFLQLLLLLLPANEQLFAWSSSFSGPLLGSKMGLQQQQPPHQEDQQPLQHRQQQHQEQLGEKLRHPWVLLRLLDYYRERFPLRNPAFLREMSCLKGMLLMLLLLNLLQLSLSPS